MKKTTVLCAGIFLTACSNIVVKGDEDSVTIQYDQEYLYQATPAAEEHCKKYERRALQRKQYRSGLSRYMYFECVK